MNFDVKFSKVSSLGFEVLKKAIGFNGYRNERCADGENINYGTTLEFGACYLFDYCDDGKSLISFIITDQGKNVFCYFQDIIPQQTVDSLFIGNITKFCLQEQGYFCLHASAVLINDKAILIMGRKGAGKSTLASFFHLNGHEIWCDDYSVLHQEENSFFVSQGETSLKVNSDILTAFSIPEDKVKPVFEVPAHLKDNGQYDLFSRKSYLNPAKYSSDTTPRKISGIFFLQKRTANPTHFVESIGKSEVLSVLMEEILLPGFNSKEYIKTYFQSSVKLLQKAPCFKIHAPDDITRIKEVYDGVIDKLNIS